MNIEDKIAHGDFATMLFQLWSGQVQYIEYGNQEEPWLSCLRIRRIPTPAGIQFAVKMLNFAGHEGSGMYFHNLPDEVLRMKLTLARLIAKYEEPNPMIQRLRALKKLTAAPERLPLTFFVQPLKQEAA